jgi:FAD/FMN-containing dehydrogenase
MVNFWARTNRRQLLKRAAALSIMATGCARVVRPTAPPRRVRPGNPAWPSEASWERLRGDVGGRLIKPTMPPVAPRNAFAVGDQPALTQTSGYLDAWMSVPSAYAVLAANTADVVAAVNFARDHRLRLVVKGGGHSYQGTSCSADSLLIWTRAMNRIALHDGFVPQGCAGTLAPQPAVTVGAGAIWMQVYDAVTTRHGRYAQGGGCTTVGVAGLVQGGGFGSFSRYYGLAAAGLLEAEVVTADGVVRIANRCTNPDLFWALKGGGGGTFGVVTRLTLRTRELPEYFGSAFGRIRAASEPSFRRLIARFVDFYHERLFNRQWGEQIRVGPDRTVDISMVAHGLNGRAIADVWRPFLDWVNSAPHDFAWAMPLQIAAFPARHAWDVKFLKEHAPQAIVADDRPGAPAENFIWAGDHGQTGQFLHGFGSVWLPASLLEKAHQPALVEALLAASRQWRISLHFNKGLAGTSADAHAEARDTPMNPIVLEAFALAILGAGGPPAFAGISSPPDLAVARRNAAAIGRAMNELSKVAPQAGAYVSESDFFEHEWQRAFWGPNYPRLVAVKRRYDPDGLFFVHHGVGSEAWTGSAGG